MPPISDYNIYISGMEKSMKDKLFWLDRIPKEDYSVVVDYGCADGTFLSKVKEYNPGCFICGIDIDDWMLNEAKKKFDSNAVFFNEAVLSHLHIQGDVLNLSSVIHEVYSYKNPIEVYNFWKYVEGHKYVCIRDMCVDQESLNTFTPPQLPEIDNQEIMRRKEFENIWGALTDPKNFIHYMLKYRYVENWNREIRENYLPVYYENLIKIANLLRYDIIYSNHYILPFLQKKVKEDWDFDLTVPTHIQMIWKKRPQQVIL